MGQPRYCNYKFIISVISISLINIRQQLTNVFHLAGLFHCLRRCVIPVPTGAEENPENPLHVNGNISGIFIFISHVNSLVGILSFWNKGKKRIILCMSTSSLSQRFAQGKRMLLLPKPYLIHLILKNPMYI